MNRVHIRFDVRACIARANRRGDMPQDPDGSPECSSLPAKEFASKSLAIYLLCKQAATIISQDQAMVEFRRGTRSRDCRRTQHKNRNRPRSLRCVASDPGSRAVLRQKSDPPDALPKASRRSGTAQRRRRLDRRICWLRLLHRSDMEVYRLIEVAEGATDPVSPWGELSRPVRSSTRLTLAQYSFAQGDRSRPCSFNCDHGE